VLRLTYDGWDWGKIENIVEQNTDLVQNTAQRIINKAFDALSNCYDNDNWERPQFDTLLRLKTREPQAWGY
jgi:putative transposase